MHLGYHISQGKWKFKWVEQGYSIDSPWWYYKHYYCILCRITYPKERILHWQLIKRKWQKKSDKKLCFLHSLTLRGQRKQYKRKWKQRQDNCRKLVEKGNEGLECAKWGEEKKRERCEQMKRTKSREKKVQKGKHSHVQNWQAPKPTRERVEVEKGVDNLLNLRTERTKESRQKKMMKNK